MTRRVEQMSALLHQAIQEVLSKGLADPRVSGLITVTKIRLSPDFAQCKVWVSVLPQERQKLCFHGIKAATTHIRREVGKKVDSRKLPHFEFELDESLKKQITVIDALEKAKAEAPKGWGTMAAQPAPVEGEATS